MSQTLTSQQYYRGLNRRFDRRAALLRRLGFVYQAIPGMLLAVFARPQRYRPDRVDAIPAHALHYADSRAWLDLLAGMLRRF